MTIYDKGMRILLEIIVCFIAGMGAGLGTGFAGMSAAAVISPMLITFLGMPAYQAVGIALASDVLASAASAYTYGKNKNLDIRNGLIMMAAVLVMTMVGSWLASLMPDSTMGSFSVIMTLLLGVKFIAKPVMTTKELMNGVSRKVRVIQSVVCGIVIGFICGFVGAGGGMMLLLILTSVLGYELKNRCGDQRFYYDFYSFYRSSQPFYYRRDAGHKLPGTLHHLYLDLGRDRSPLRKQSRAYYSEPCDRSRTDNPGSNNDRGKFAMKAQSQSIGPWTASSPMGLSFRDANQHEQGGRQAGL